MKCSKCFYKKIEHDGWCFQKKRPPIKECGKFKTFPNTLEDKRLASDDPFWDAALRAANGLG